MNIVDGLGLEVGASGILPLSPCSGRFLIFLCSLPEQTLLSTSHLLGGSERLTLNKEILVELSILGPIAGLLFLAKKVVMEGTSQGFFLLA